MANENTKVVREQGGNTLRIDSGGELDMRTGSKILANGTQAAAVTALTDSSTGAAGNTIANVGTEFSQATLNNNFASLSAKVNAALAALKGAGIIA